MEIVNVAAIAVGTPARKRALAGLDLSEEEEFMTHFRHAAIAAALESGARSQDIARPGEPVLGTREMGSRVVGLVLAEALEGLS